MNNRDCAKGGKTNLGGSIKDHSTARFHKYADGGRVSMKKGYADGDLVIKPTDPFRDDASANTAFAAKEAYEAKGRDWRQSEPAEAPMRTQAGPAAGMGSDVEAMAAAGPAPTVPAAPAPTMGTAATEDRGFTPSVKADLANAGVKPGKTKAEKAAQVMGAAVADAFSDQPSRAAASAARAKKAMSDEPEAKTAPAAPAEGVSHPMATLGKKVASFFKGSSEAPAKGTKGSPEWKRENEKALAKRRAAGEDV